jgi:hypothetical protein
MAEEEEEIVAIKLKPTKFLKKTQSKARSKNMDLSSKERDSVFSLKKQRDEEIENQQQLLRLCFILMLEVSEGDSTTIAQALGTHISPQDPLTGSSRTTPVGQLRDLIAQYFFDKDFTFDGKEGDCSGIERKGEDFINLLNDNLKVPLDTWKKVGLKFADVTSPNSIVKIHGCDHRVLCNNDNDDEIVICEEVSLLPKLTKVNFSSYNIRIFIIYVWYCRQATLEKNIVCKIDFIGNRLDKIVRESIAVKKMDFPNDRCWSARFITEGGRDGNEEEALGAKRKRHGHVVPTLHTAGFFANFLDLPAYLSPIAKVRTKFLIYNLCLL